jgi:hypothetical protein
MTEGGRPIDRGLVTASVDALLLLGAASTFRAAFAALRESELLLGVGAH